MTYGKITIFGMGLIGGAIGLDLKKKGLAKEVCGCGRNSAHLKQAIEMEACDTTTLEMSEAINNAEIIILATPPKIIKVQLTEIVPYLKEKMLIMDVGSIKGSILEASSNAKIYKTGAEFLGCHPMAGSEKTGVTNAKAQMFKNAPCILTPAEDNTEKGVEKGKKFWKELGAKIIILDPYEHDLFISFMSHLPHVISSTFVKNSVEKLKDTKIISKLSGPSFIELTRLASSSPAMWSQIYTENRKQVLFAIDTFIEALEKFKKLLLKKEDKKIEKFLHQAAEYKKKLCSSN